MLPVKQKHNGRFRITSFLQLESRTCLRRSRACGNRDASPSSHSSFCEEVFSRPSRTGTHQRFGLQRKRGLSSLTGSSVTLANEVERSNILAPGFSPSSRLHRRLPTIGLGKSYPVTAAQLLPILTGFLAPIHFFKLAKNCPRTTPLPFRAQDLFVPAPVYRIRNREIVNRLCIDRIVDSVVRMLRTRVREGPSNWRSQS